MEALFPSAENRACLSKKLRDSKGSLATFTDLDLWHWHAYDYAFRRVFLGVSDARSTIDPEGRWFDSRVVDDAEMWLRGKHKMSEPKRYPAALRADEIREDCRKIPVNQLTPVEREFLEPSIAAMVRRARSLLKEAETKWKMAFRGPRKTHYEAPAEPIELPDVTITDPALAEQARARLGL